MQSVLRLCIFKVVAHREYRLSELIGRSLRDIGHLYAWLHLVGSESNHCLLRRPFKLLCRLGNTVNIAFSSLDLLILRRCGWSGWLRLLIDWV